jgi:hypothetical protein
MLRSGISDDHVLLAVTDAAVMSNRRTGKKTAATVAAPPIRVASAALLS